jgi:hypothetical protein
MAKITAAMMTMTSALMGVPLLLPYLRRCTPQAPTSMLHPLRVAGTGV